MSTLDLEPSILTINWKPTGQKIDVDVMKESLRIDRVSGGPKTDPEKWIPILQDELKEVHGVDFGYGGTFNYVIAIRKAFEDIKKKLDQSLGLHSGTK